MIDLHFWTTPNGYKVMLFLEEAGLKYRIVPVNISKGDQFSPAFLQIAPNNRIPAIVDRAPANGGAAVPVFESGAILHYLAEKTGRFLPADGAARSEVMQWLFWQMGGLGPMLGQHLHFSAYAPEKLDYAIARYAAEAKRLYGVLDRRLAGREFIADAYSIADMASFPWIHRLAGDGSALDDFPNVTRWHDAIAARPPTIDETSLPFRTRDDPPAGGPGRSHDGKLLVVGAVEIGDGNTPGRLRLARIASYGAGELNRFIGRDMAADGTAKTDGWAGYARVPVAGHQPHVVGAMAAHVVLPWIHQVFSNLKGWARGVYHGLRPKYLQSYLDEFVFRFNRRTTRHAAFRSLFDIALRAKPVTYNILRQPELCA